MVDVIGAQRAADYCNPELAAEYREWLQRLLAEQDDNEAPRVTPSTWSGEQDALHDLSAETQKQLSQTLLRGRVLMYFDQAGKMHFQLIDPTAAIVNKDQLAAYIGDPQGAPRSWLPDILDAVSHRMKAPY